MSDTPVRVMSFGLGPIGCRVIRGLAERRGFQLVAAVDPQPVLAGQDAGRLAGLDRALGVAVVDNPEQVLLRVPADVAVMCTASRVADIYPALHEVISAGLNVVTTCEELVFPWKTAPEAAHKLDAAARASGVSVLATGVNPGFMMDFFPLTVSALCQSVDRVTVERIQDASTRRLPFQRRIGAGLSPAEFERKLAAGSFGHVGLRESMGMLAAALGFTLAGIEETVSPVVATTAVRSPEVAVKAGAVAGIRQVAVGADEAGVERVRLEFQAAIGQAKPFDRVRIKGVPDLEVLFPGGVHGDIATAAVILNAIPAIRRAPAGLLTMADLSLHWRP